jgi:AP-1-like transcription factor
MLIRFVEQRRRAQNRASQRAYRERKDQRIKDLEQMLNEAKSRNDVLSQAYAALHAEYVALKAAQLKDQQSYQTELVFDPTMGMTNNDRLDMDLFVYPDMSNTYSL